MPLVVSIERGIQQAKRTLILLSQAYLEDNLADFENVVAQSWASRKAPTASCR